MGATYEHATVHWQQGKSELWANCLTHWGRDKMDAISQTIFSVVFSWMKSFVFWLKFHWSLFLRAQLTITAHMCGTKGRWDNDLQRGFETLTLDSKPRCHLMIDICTDANAWRQSNCQLWAMIDRYIYRCMYIHCYVLGMHIKCVLVLPLIINVWTPQ